MELKPEDLKKGGRNVVPKSVEVEMEILGG
jgi:hypothetical protein